MYIIYLTSLQPNVSVDFQYINARQLSKYYKVIFICSKNPHISWRNILFSYSKLYKTFLAIRNSSFIHWHFIDLIPFGSFHFISRINQKINALMINLIFARQRYPIVINTTIEENICLFAKQIHPILTISEIFDVFSKEETKAFAKNSDVVFVNSRAVELLALKYSKNVVLVPGGFFKRKLIESLGNLSLHKPKASIFLTCSLTWRVDFELIKKIALTFPKTQFVIAGPELFSHSIDENWDNRNKRALPKWEELKKINNVLYFKTRNYNDLKKIKCKLSCGIIPIKKNIPLNHFSNPIRLYIYYALGIPVVGFDIPTIKSNNDCFILSAKNELEFIESIRKLQSLEISAIEKKIMIEKAEFHTLEHKMKVVIPIINNFYNQKLGK